MVNETLLMKSQATGKAMTCMVSRWLDSVPSEADEQTLRDVERCAANVYIVRHPVLSHHLSLHILTLLLRRAAQTQ
jgi:hypothetical protein